MQSDSKADDLSPEVSEPDALYSGLEYRRCCHVQVLGPGSSFSLVRVWSSSGRCHLKHWARALGDDGLRSSSALAAARFGESVAGAPPLRNLLCAASARHWSFASDRLFQSGPRGFQILLRGAVCMCNRALFSGCVTAISCEESLYPYSEDCRSCDHSNVQICTDLSYDAQVASFTVACSQGCNCASYFGCTIFMYLPCSGVYAARSFESGPNQVPKKHIGGSGMLTSVWPFRLVDAPCQDTLVSILSHCALLLVPFFRTLLLYSSRRSVQHHHSSEEKPAHPRSSPTPAKSPAIACKLLEEPVSNSFADRDRVEHARDFVTGEGREWPFVPATDPFALERAANRDMTDTAAEEMEEALNLVFHVLTPGYVAEVVLVSLVPPVDVEDAIARVQEARDPVHARLFPVLTAAEPQPAADHGVLLARPGWALQDTLLYFDLTDVDGRRFVLPGPTMASRETILDLAEINDHDTVDVYVGTGPTPMGVIEHVALGDNTSIFLVPRYFLPGPYFWLQDILANSLNWSAIPTLPVGPPANHVCAVSVEGVRKVNVATDSVLVDTAGFANAFGYDPACVRMHPAMPVIRDADVSGYPCRNVCAVAADAGVGDAPWLVIVDCRAILLGWMVWEVDDNTLSLAALASDIEATTLCPDGWRVYLEGDSVRDQFPRQGAVVYASFVPLMQTEALTREEGQESEVPTDDEMASVLEEETSTGPVPEEEDSRGARSSRSRSPRRSSESGRAPLPDGFAVAPFLVLSQEYRPEPVHLILSGALTVEQAIKRVSDSRFAAQRRRFPVLI
eukprot:s3951_g18.t1